MISSSWYMVLPSSALKPGARRSERALGTEIALQRDPRGRVEARDARGRDRHVDELDGMILVWEGDAEPSYTIERCPELASGRWTEVAWGSTGPHRASVATVQRDVVDNDHFGAVHHVQQAETRAYESGRYLDTVTHGIIDMRRLGGPPLLGHIRLDGRLHCPGLLTYRTTVTVGVQFHSLVLSAPLPLGDGRVRMYTGIATPKQLIPGTAALLQRAILRSILVDHERDAPLWELSSAPPPSDGRGVELHAAYDRWLDRFRGAVHA